MTKKRGLGSKRGLDALMGSIKQETALTKTALSLTDNKDGQSVVLVQMDISRLQSGKYQPRRNMDESALQELASSVAQHGIMQPIVIRPLSMTKDTSDGGITHEIIAGERRWRAAKMAGLTTIPAIERELSDDVAIALALIENIQREELNVLEQAAALQRFHTEFGMSHAMIAEVVGKARVTVTNLLRLNNLHDDVKALIAKGMLDMGHARALLSLSTAQQPTIAKKMVQAQMTVREAEKLVKSILNPTPKSISSHDTTTLLNQKLSDSLGTSARVKCSKDGKGSIEIFFYDHDSFVQLMTKMGVEDV